MPSAQRDTGQGELRSSPRPKADECFLFGPFRLIPGQGVLLEEGVAVRLGSRALDMLFLLVDRSPEVVAHREILSYVWPDTSVDENNLRVNLTALRKALREEQRDRRYIVNIPGCGYRFAGPVVRTEHTACKKVSSNISKSLMPLLGRDDAIQAIAEEVPQGRFVTITGPGGVGKSSVARAVANRLASSYPDGVCLVDLTSVSDADGLATALGAAVHGRTDSGTDLQSTLRHLHGRRMLIVLDSCEQVVDGAAHLAEDLLKVCATNAVIATCREPLGVEGEWVFGLRGLRTPPRSSALSAAEALDFPVVRLFVQRAEMGAEPFVLTDAEAPALAELCHKLDGIPLAIELAAACVGLLGIRGLTARLDDGFCPAYAGLAYGSTSPGESAGNTRLEL